MRYYVYIDGISVYNLDSEDYILIDPIVNDKLNEASSFEFTMPPQNKAYDVPKLLKSTVLVTDSENNIIFYGRISEIDTDFWKNKKIYCEGPLAWLNDTIQPVYEKDDFTIPSFISYLLTNHNSEVSEDRQVSLGKCLPKNTDSVYRSLNHELTYNAFKDMVLGTEGGYVYTTFEPSKVTISDADNKQYPMLVETKTSYFDSNGDEIIVPAGTDRDITMTANDGTRYRIKTTKHYRVFGPNGEAMPVIEFPKASIKYKGQDYPIEFVDACKSQEIEYEEKDRYNSKHTVKRSATVDIINNVEYMLNNGRYNRGNQYYLYPQGRDKAKLASFYTNKISIADIVDYGDTEKKSNVSNYSMQSSGYRSNYRFNGIGNKRAFNKSDIVFKYAGFRAANDNKLIFTFGVRVSPKRVDELEYGYYGYYDTNVSYPEPNFNTKEIVCYFKDKYGFWNKIDGAGNAEISHVLNLATLSYQLHKNNKSNPQSTAEYFDSSVLRDQGYGGGANYEERRRYEQYMQSNPNATVYCSDRNLSYGYGGGYGRQNIVYDESVPDGKIKVVTTSTTVTTTWDYEVSLRAASQNTFLSGYMVDYSKTGAATDTAAMSEAPIHPTSSTDTTLVANIPNNELHYLMNKEIETFDDDNRSRDGKKDINNTNSPQMYGEKDLPYYYEGLSNPDSKGYTGGGYNGDYDRTVSVNVRTKKEEYTAEVYYTYELLTMDGDAVKKSTMYYNYFVDAGKHKNYTPANILNTTTMLAADGKEYTLMPSGFKALLNYEAELRETSSQNVVFGSNLQDLTQKEDASKVYTELIPFGKDDLSLGKDAKAISGNVQSNDEYVKKFGKILKTKSWSDVKDAKTLTSKGKQQLEDHQDDYYSIEATAIDLHAQNQKYDLYKIGQKVHIISKPHNINDIYPIKEIETNLNKGTRIIKTGTLDNDDLNTISKPEAQPKQETTTTVITNIVNPVAVPMQIDVKNATTSKGAIGKISAKSWGPNTTIVATFNNGNTMDVTSKCKFSPESTSKAGTVNVDITLYYNPNTGWPLDPGSISSNARSVKTTKSLTVDATQASTSVINLDNNTDDYITKYGSNWTTTPHSCTQAHVTKGQRSSVGGCTAAGHTFSCWCTEDYAYGSENGSTIVTGGDGYPVYADTPFTNADGTWKVESGTLYARFDLKWVPTSIPKGWVRSN